MTVEQEGENQFHLTLSVGCAPPEKKGQKRPATEGKKQVRPKAKRRKVTSEPTRGGEGRKQKDTAGKSKTATESGTTSERVVRKARRPTPAPKTKTTTESRSFQEKQEGEKSTTDCETFNVSMEALTFMTFGVSDGKRRKTQYRVAFDALYGMVNSWRILMFLAMLLTVYYLSIKRVNVCTPTPTNVKQISYVQAVIGADCFMYLVACWGCVLIADLFFKKGCAINSPDPCRITHASMHVMTRSFWCALQMVPLASFVWPIAFYGTSFYLDSTMTLFKQRVIWVSCLSLAMMVAALVVTNCFLRMKRAATTGTQAPNDVATHGHVATWLNNCWKCCFEMYPDAEVVPQVAWTIGVAVAMITGWFFLNVAGMLDFQTRANAGSCGYANSGVDFKDSFTPNPFKYENGTSDAESCALNHAVQVTKMWGPCETFEKATATLSYALSWFIYLYRERDNTPSGIIPNLLASTHDRYKQLVGIRIVDVSQRAQRAAAVTRQQTDAKVDCDMLGLKRFSDGTTALFAKMCEIVAIGNVMLSWYMYTMAPCRELVPKPNTPVSREHRTDVIQTVLGVIMIVIAVIATPYITSFAVHHTGPWMFFLFGPPLYLLSMLVYEKFQQYTFTAALSSVWG